MKKNNLIKLIKQSTAGLLTAAMVLTGAPLGNMTVMAAGLSPNTNLSPGDGQRNKWVSQVDGFTYGSSDSTAFAFGDVRYRKTLSLNGIGYTNRTSRITSISQTGDASTFSIAGLVSSNDRANNTNGYYSFG